MEFKVETKKKALKNLKKLPVYIQETFSLLTQDLKEFGPILKQWSNYSPLGKDKYHCHLDYSYVACWEYKKEIIMIEVYYVGSRENAPY